MDRLLTYISEVSKDAERRLQIILPFGDIDPTELHEAMRYAVLGGGKRLRPLMTVASYEAAGGVPQERNAAFDAGLGIELLHCYSLVHDDLPCMDNDMMRRGRLSVHKAFGEATAILVGDALQALAFGVIAQAGGPRAALLTAELAHAAGSRGMVGGQMLDLLGEGQAQVIEDIERIDRWKTGALFVCCCRVGGIMAGADDVTLQSLTEYGKALGVMYQISDDIMDVSAAKGPKSADEQVGKLTYPAALGLAGAREAVVQKCTEAKLAIKDLGRGALYLRLLVDYLQNRVMPEKEA